MHTTAPIAEPGASASVRELLHPHPLLVGDVGGTKTTLALVDHAGTITRERTFASRDYPAFLDVVAAFREEAAPEVSRAALSVAGPVVGGRARITNLPWTLDAAALGEAFGGVPVALVNDLCATAMAIPGLGESQLVTLHPGEAEPGGTRAVIALGTGLGEAVLVPEGAGYRPLPSEGGHADFAPRGNLQRTLHAWLEREHGHASNEMVCSGLGIPHLHRFLAERSGTPAPHLALPDPTPAIVADAMAPAPEPLCRRTLELLAAILGGEAGNLALRSLATGGLYLAGGIPPRILPVLRESAFRDAYLSRGRFTALVERIPVHVVLEPRAPLLGAVRVAVGAG